MCLFLDTIKAQVAATHMNDDTSVNENSISRPVLLDECDIE
jgi:hypothetical protein